VFTYNIAGWMRSGPDAPVADFRHDQPVTLAFMFSQAKQDEMQSLIQRFGTSPTGIGRILTKMNITRTWRDPVALQ
jgi:hypothetical protein